MNWRPISNVIDLNCVTPNNNGNPVNCWRQFKITLKGVRILKYRKKKIRQRSVVSLLPWCHPTQTSLSVLQTQEQQSIRHLSFSKAKKCKHQGRKFILDFCSPEIKCSLSTMTRYTANSSTGSSCFSMWRTEWRELSMLLNVGRPKSLLRQHSYRAVFEITNSFSWTTTKMIWMDCSLQVLSRICIGSDKCQNNINLA